MALVTGAEVAVGKAGERFEENGRLNEPNLGQEVRGLEYAARRRSVRRNRPARGDLRKRAATGPNATWR
jgi:hypothetical protein